MLSQLPWMKGLTGLDTELRQAEEEGRALVIRPSRDLGVKRMEKDLRKVQAQYDLGREDALGKVEEVKRFLGQEG